MSDGTKIEWAEATWNPITGCSVLSPGCTNCYAQRLAGTRMKTHWSRIGLTRSTKAGPVWNGVVRLNVEWLDQPLRWKRARRIFVCAHGDLFHELVPDEWIDRIFAVMALRPQHTFQILTKRAERMREYCGALATPGRICRHLHALAEEAKGNAFTLWQAQERLINWPLPNVWLLVSVEDQSRADERIPLLLDTLAAVRGISAEPLLESVDLGAPLFPDEVDRRGSLIGGAPYPGDAWRRLDWVIIGGESGPSSRPFDIAWARSIIAQCKAAGVACFMKQLGANPQTKYEYATGLLPLRDRKGGDMQEWPPDLRVREYPAQKPACLEANK